MWQTYIALCLKFLLDKFLNEIEILKGDIYYICNDSEGYNGMSRLNALDNRRKLFYLRLTFKTSLVKSIGKSKQEKNLPHIEMMKFLTTSSEIGLWMMNGLNFKIYTQILFFTALRILL